VLISVTSTEAHLVVEHEPLPARSLHLQSGDHDEDPDAEDDRDGNYLSRRRAREAEITAALEQVRASVLAEDALCSAGHWEAREIVVRHLKAILTKLTPYDVPSELVAPVRREVSLRHHSELFAAAEGMTADVVAGLPTGVAARSITLEELTPYAKEVQLRRHPCATNATARALARRVKDEAKRRPTGQ
jgi:hypothetical protein